MNVLIFGSRSFKDYAKAEQEILDLLPKGIVPTFICGCAKGADQINNYLHARYVSNIQYYPAQWGNLNAEPCKVVQAINGCSYNALAGYNRNLQMIEEGKPDIAIAFWNQRSTGTADMIQKVLDNNIPLYLSTF